MKKVKFKTEIVNVKAVLTNEELRTDLKYLCKMRKPRLNHEHEFTSYRLALHAT